MTTIIGIRKDNSVVIAGDGQASLGNTVMKSNVKKIRRLGNDNSVISGFAGSTADAFALFERLESKLDQYKNQLMRACVELAKDWRTDKYLRKLEAMMIVANKDVSLLLSGTGDVIESDDGILAIGSGGPFANSAAKALLKNTDMNAKDIAIESLNIAADICIYTNHNIISETRETVSELDKFIIGQKNAKRAVSVALRNRWRRKQLDKDLQDEIVPKNILMVGPTGCGKTEISRRLAKLANAPFVKVEATKFTEVGYVGRDVEQIIRDLVEISINHTKEKMGKEVKAKAEKNAEEKVLDILVSKNSSDTTRENFRQKLRNGELSDKEVEIPVSANSSMNLPTMDIPGMPGSQMGMINLGDVFGKGFGKQKKIKKLSVKDSHAYLLQEETEKLLDQEKINSRALEEVEQNGIVFIDEIDKITSRSDRSGADVSREGVQRDLLPLIEGTAVSTKHGVVKTDYILFIASGAFHLSKPSDMLPELQGRLPIRVELESLSKDDFKLILTETQNSLIKQYVGLLGTEKVDLEFEEDGIDSIATLATEINQNIENIGARRLHTIMEKLLEEVSFNASDIGPTKITINKEFVEKNLVDLIKSQDLSKFIL